LKEAQIGSKCTQFILDGEMRDLGLSHPGDTSARGGLLWTSPHAVQRTTKCWSALELSMLTT